MRSVFQYFPILMLSLMLIACGGKQEKLISAE